MTRLQRILFLGAILFFLATRWNSFTIPFERDEGEYAYSAWLMSAGILPYENAFLQKPPLIVYVYQFAQFIAEDSVVVPRVLSTLALALTIIAVYLIVLRESGVWPALTAIWLMPVMLAGKVLTPYAANTEVFLLLPLMVVLLLYVWKRGEASEAVWFLAGICSSLSLLFKPIAVAVVLFLFTLWSIDTWRTTGDLRGMLRRLAAGCLGVTLCAAVSLGPFLLHDGGRSLYECVVRYNIHYSGANTFGLDPFLSYMGDFLGAWWVAFLLLPVLVILRPHRWWLFPSLLGVALLTIVQAALGHYYLLMVPFVAIIASTSLHALVTRLEESFPRTPSVVRVAGSTAVVLIVLIPQLEQFRMPPSELSDWFYSRANPFPEAQMVGTMIRAASQKDDLVFVAGSEPEILFYAKRRSPSRFVIMYPLMLSTPFARQYQEEAKASLIEHPPEFVVLATSRFSWLEQPDSPTILKDYLIKLLREDYVVRGGVLRGTAEWTPLIEERGFNKFSLVVYQRRGGMQ